MAFFLIIIGRIFDIFVSLENKTTGMVLDKDIHGPFIKGAVLDIKKRTLLLADEEPQKIINWDMALCHTSLSIYPEGF